MSRSRKDVDILSPLEASRKATILEQLPKDLASLVERSSQDPGVPFEPVARERIKRLRAEDAPTWARLRQLLKALGVPVTKLDGQTRPTTPGHKGGSPQAPSLARHGRTRLHPVSLRR